MRIVVAPDSFKGSLTAQDACQAVAAGLRRVLADAEIDLMPLADGGEGTLHALQAASGGTLERISVPDAYGRPRSAHILWGADGVATVEVAQCCPFESAPPGPAVSASSYGLGVAMRHALQQGATGLVVALGGSATSDGGLGALQALGGQVDLGGGQTVRDAVAIRSLPPLGVPLTALCDVLVPLCGPEGAIRQFGPQKGLLAHELDALDAAMARWATLLQAASGRAVLDATGAGAAGGIGALLLALGARLRSGAEAVLEAAQAQQRLRGAALCVTGEGSLDRQSAHGKIVARLSGQCVAAGVPCIALVGARRDVDAVTATSLTAALSIVPGPTDRDSALAHAAVWLADTAEQVARVWAAGRGR